MVLDGVLRRAATSPELWSDNQISSDERIVQIAFTNKIQSKKECSALFSRPDILFAQLVMQSLVQLISNSFQPFGLSGGDSDVLEPAVLGGTMPVFHAVMDYDDIPWLQ